MEIDEAETAGEAGDNFGNSLLEWRGCGLSTPALVQRLDVALERPVEAARLRRRYGWPTSVFGNAYVSSSAGPR
jgi:hypothetical protein